jgi:hypothetical protein
MVGGDDREAGCVFLDADHPSATVNMATIVVAERIRPPVRELANLPSPNSGSVAQTVGKLCGSPRTAKYRGPETERIPLSVRGLGAVGRPGETPGVS